MKEKIIDFIVELICVVTIYALLMFGANKFGIIESSQDIIATSIGFAIGWSTVKITNIIRQNKKEKK